MARIVKVDNETGDSQYGRLVTYMITLPGANEETRREVKADDRVLPRTIPGPCTALLDYRTADVELYCALPYVAVSKFASAEPSSAQQRVQSPQPSAPRAMPQIPTQPAAPTATPGNMAPLGAMGTQAPPPEPDDTSKEPKRAAPDSGAAKLPWEK